METRYKRAQTARRSHSRLDGETRRRGGTFPLLRLGDVAVCGRLGPRGVGGTRYERVRRTPEMVVLSRSLVFPNGLVVLNLRWNTMSPAA